MSRACTARASREESWWTVTVDEVPGLFTQTRRLDQVEDMVRDALALFPEVETAPESAVVSTVIDGGITASTKTTPNSRLSESC